MTYLLDKDGYRLLDSEGYLLIGYEPFTLITDRTRADVDRVKSLLAKGFNNMTAGEIEEFLAGMKGAYNATDLNRVESAVEYVAQRLSAAGFYPVLSTKTSWSLEDFPTVAEMRRYLDNIRFLRSRLPMDSTVPPVPDDMNRLTHEEANNLEKILLSIDDVITKISQAWLYSGDIYSGEV